MASDTDKILKRFEEQTEEIKQHMDVRAEETESKLQAVAEQVAANAEKLTEHDRRFLQMQETLESHHAQFTQVHETLGTIKTDVQFIKNELKQKVDQEEFSALESRVSALEDKLSPQWR